MAARSELTEIDVTRHRLEQRDLHWLLCRYIPEKLGHGGHVLAYIGPAVLPRSLLAIVR